MDVAIFVKCNDI